MVPPVDLPSRVDRLLAWLGYEAGANWLDHDGLDQAKGCRYLLGQAFSDMSVSGAFGLRRFRPDQVTPDFIPFVYVAVAEGERQAMTVHKRVWSQGVVPFLLIVGPDRVWSCDATRYSSVAWNGKAVSLPGDIAGGRDLFPIDDLRHLKSSRIRSSITFGDAEKGSASGSRVDGRLLEGLRALGKRLTGKTAAGGLATHVANRIIGCVLYLFCLRDRRIVTDLWLSDNGHGHMLDDAEWELADLWKLFGDLNVVLNGTIFDIMEEDRAGITAAHVDLVRRVIKNGEKLVEQGSQASFLDIDLSVVRTETLSAVYEMFFEIQGEKAKDEDGAFYTPPFLVDHVLAKVDEISRVEAGVRVCDCAAGSGMFLVGAYRRMLEGILDGEGIGRLPLDTARGVLETSIFGIERNPDAALVAAFSLFLTMLEYVGGRLELGPAPGRGGVTCEPVFPGLVGNNILVRDTFDKEPLPPAFQEKFQVVVGNPPWQRVKVLGGSVEAAAPGYAKRMDHGRAADMFFWFSHDSLLAEGGAFGMVLSAKSFLSPGANRFPRTLMEHAGVTGIVNLTHLRRRLFPGAEHPAVAVVGRRATPKPSDAVWIHFPLLSALPLDREGSPWCIVENKADVETHPKRALATPERLFQAMMLRPMDRRIATYLDDMCLSEAAMTVGRLCQVTKLNLRGGGPPNRTKLPESFHLGTSPAVDYLVSLGLQQPKETGHRRKKNKEGNPYAAPAVFSSYSVQPSDLLAADGKYVSMFSGDIVAMPRSLRRADFIRRPFAFNSSIYALFFDKDGGALSTDQMNMLKALAKYLNSSFAKYLAALYGRMWIVDRRRLEISDLEKFPVPFRGMADDNICKVNEAPADALDRVLMDLIGFSDQYRRAFEEYAKTREGVENGRQPGTLLEPPDEGAVEAYRSTLEHELGQFFTSNWRVSVHTSRHDEASAAVGIRFRKLDGHRPERTDDHVVVRRQGTSSDLDYDSASRTAVLSKSWVAARWLEEQAVTDARRVIQCVLATPGTGSTA